MYIAVERNITDPVVTEIRLIDLSEVCARGILWQTDDGRNIYTFLIKISGAKRGSIKDSLLEVTFIEEQLERVEPNVSSNTIPEARGKGYAASLIYQLTNKVLKDGYHISLYTDYKYIPSNKAYKNVGYIDDDVLINFSCTKKNIKSLQVK